MPSTPCPLALVALLVLAGCSGLSAPGEPTVRESTTTPGPVGSPTTTVPTLQVVDYRGLSNETRQVVRTAVEEGSVTTDRSRVDGLEPRATTRLRYEGRLYQLSWEHAGLRAEYSLGLEPVNASAIEPSDDVVAYGNLSTTSRRRFDAALAGEPSDPTESSPGIGQIDYVQYRGSYFRPLVIVADIPQVTIEAEPVDTGPGTSTSDG